MDRFRHANRLNWDERARLHASDTGGFYRIDEVLGGRSVLHEIEADAIGDIAGRRIAHLQCHIGLDSLSLAHLGADVTGLDFSGEAIAAARDFAARAGRAVTFVESDVYAARAALDGHFDMVFVTWGAINWLPDIRGWARVVASLLRPGGSLFLAESHPVALCLEERNGEIVAAYDWRTPVDRPLVFADETTYTGDSRRLTHVETYEWIHPLEAILGAIGEAGLVIASFREHERLPYRLFPCMVADAAPGLFRLPDHKPRLPLSFCLTARRAP